MTRPVDEMTPEAWHEAYSALAAAAWVNNGAPNWNYDCPARIHVQRKRIYRDALIERACREACFG